MHTSNNAHITQCTPHTMHTSHNAHLKQDKHHTMHTSNQCTPQPLHTSNTAHLNPNQRVYTGVVLTGVVYRIGQPVCPIVKQPTAPPFRIVHQPPCRHSVHQTLGHSTACRTLKKGMDRSGNVSQT
jgi:hypothetical protein